MNELNPMRLREALHKLFAAAGYVEEELEEFLEEAIRTMEHQDSKPSAPAKAKKPIANTMNSKLYEALRE